jgi:hypothetical protein
MFYTRFFQYRHKLLDALADKVCIAANPDKICVAVPSGDNMYVHMVGQARAGAPAEIDSDIEAMRLNRERKHLLGVPCKFCHLKKLSVACLVKIGNMPGGRDEQMAIVIREAIHHRDATLGPPQDKIFVVILRGFDIFTDEALVFVGKALDIPDSPRSPEIFAFQFFAFR